MKKICIAFLLLVNLVAADVIDEKHTIDFVRSSDTDLRVYQGNYKPYEWTVQMDGSNISQAGYVPFLYWAVKTTSPDTIPATCSWVTNYTTTITNYSGTNILSTNYFTNMVFSAYFDSAQINTNGDFMYGVGVTYTNGSKVSVTRQGAFKIQADPYSGGGVLNFTGNINGPSYGFIGSFSNWPFIARSATTGEVDMLSRLTYRGTNYMLAGEGGSGNMVGANNLAELTNPSAARTNLGIGAIIASWEAGAGLTNAGSSLNPIGALNAASVASLARADAAVTNDQTSVNFGVMTLGTDQTTNMVATFCQSGTVALLNNIASTNQVALATRNYAVSATGNSYFGGSIQATNDTVSAFLSTPYSGGKAAGRFYNTADALHPYSVSLCDADWAMFVSGDVVFDGSFYDRTTAGTISFTPSSRQLIASNGTSVALNWSAVGIVDCGTNKVTASIFDGLATSATYATTANTASNLNGIVTSSILTNGGAVAMAATNLLYDPTALTGISNNITLGAIDNYFRWSLTNASILVLSPCVSNLAASTTIDVDRNGQVLTISSANCITQGLGSVSSLTNIGNAVQSYVFRQAWAGTNTIKIMGGQLQ